MQEDYVGNIENNSALNGGETNVELTPLEEMMKIRNNYFFKNGTNDYVIYEYNNDGKIDYLKIRLINKDSLSEEIKKQLRGGGADGGKREAYMHFKDVYGVTDDLEVFYCTDGLESAVGASYINSSLFDNGKILYGKASPASKAVSESTETEAKDLTIADLRSMRELTVSDSSGAKDLKFLVDMPNITKLTIRNYEGSLSGIEYLVNLTYLLIDNKDNKINITYEGLRECTTLEEIDFYMPTDDEVEKMCQEMSNSDYENLKLVKLSGSIGNLYNGNTSNIGSISFGDRISGKSNLSKLDSLNNLSKKTKESINKLYLNNNKIKSLNGLKDFTKLEYLYLQCNEDEQSSVKISDNLSKMDSLKVFFCGYCNITNEDFKNVGLNTSIEELSLPRKYFDNRFKSTAEFDKFKKITSKRK